MSVLTSFVQFAALSVFLFVVFFGFGLAFFGLPSPSQSGALELVAASPVAAAPAAGSVVACARGCSGCPVAAGVPVLPAALSRSGCAVLQSRSGRPLSGAALSGRVGSLARSGVFQVV